MSRLTVKDKHDNYYDDLDFINFFWDNRIDKSPELKAEDRKNFNVRMNRLYNQLHKLILLEDIEEELGVDLITFIKALKQQYIYTVVRVVGKNQIVKISISTVADLVNVIKMVGHGR